MFQTIALIVVLVAALVVVATMQNVKAVEYQFCIQYDKDEGKGIETSCFSSSIPCYNFYFDLKKSGATILSSICRAVKM
jgi:hypothetical protein